MVNGSQKDVLDYYNMSPKKLAEIAKDLISKCIYQLIKALHQLLFFL